MWELLGNKELSEKEKLGTLYKMDLVLGLNIKNWEEEKIEISTEAKDLLMLRNKAREEKNWPEADRLRDELKKLGFKVLDSDSGASLEKI